MSKSITNQKVVYIWEKIYIFEKNSIILWYNKK